MSEFPAVFYFHFVLCLFKVAYYVIGFGFLLTQVKKPFIRARIPSLIVISASGFLIREALMVAIQFRAFHDHSLRNRG